MPLTVPTLEQFATFKGEEFDPTEVDRISMFLDMAAALVELELRLTVSPPLDTAEGKLVAWAIMDLAWYLGTSMEDRDAVFSPFSTERIGSYSYSKAARAMAEKDTTGIPFLDRLMRLLSARELIATAGGITFSSTQIMPTTLVHHREAVFPDPSETL